MSRRRFLLPVTALAAVLSLNNSNANTQEVVSPSDKSAKQFVPSDSGSPFDFILKRTDERFVLGAHRSHSSHSSHRSHYSSRY